MLANSDSSETPVLAIETQTLCPNEIRVTERLSPSRWTSAWRRERTQPRRR